MKRKTASAEKRAFALILFLFMLFTSGAFSVQTQTAYASGTASKWVGTVADPGTEEYVVNNSDKTVHLRSAQAMVWFIRQIYNGNDFNGYTVCLDVDVDLNNIDFTFNNKGEVFPYDESKPFRGIFDGQNHTISNFKMTTQNYRVAMFRQTENATFKNITFSNPTIYSWDSDSASYDSHAVLVGYHNAGTLTFDNVHIEGGSVEGARGVGSLVGFVAANSSGDLLTIKNCSNSAAITGRDKYIGGFAGICNPGVRAIDCENTGKVTAGSHAAGGIIGWIQDDPTEIKNCSNSGDIKGADCVGGILGYCGSPEFDPNLILTNNTNTGNITSSGTYAAGIAASIDTDGVHEISGNINRGAVSANADAGGIVGRNKGFGIWKNNENYGNVTTNTTLYAGGICAEAEDDNQTFEDCLNEGGVTGYWATGGILGHVPMNEQVFTGCVNKGDITSTNGTAGGIYGVGNGKNNYVICSRCENSGNITAHESAGGICGWINPEGKKLEGEDLESLQEDSNIRVQLFIIANPNSIEQNEITDRIDVGPNKFIDCINRGTVAAWTGNAGGLAGVINSNAQHLFSGCVNYGNIKGMGESGGGLVGINKGAGKWSKCENHGTVSDCAANAGGLAGEIRGGGSFENCSNDAAVTGSYSSGGIFGYSRGGANTFTNCTNSGNITATCENADKVTWENGNEIGKAGGIFGYIGLGEKWVSFLNEKWVSFLNFYYVGPVHGEAGSATFEDCWNTGNVKADKSAGGLGGDVTGHSVFDYCWNTGNIKADKSAGGLGGNVTGHSIFDSCWNAGDVSPYNESDSNDSYGGLAGQTGTSGTTDAQAVIACYNWGVITGKIAGGFVGAVRGTSDAYKITYSYNTGFVKGENKTGQFIGDGGSIDETCYTNVKISGATYKTDQEFIDYAFKIGNFFIKNKEGVTIGSTKFYYPILGKCSHESGYRHEEDENGNLYFVCAECGERFDSITSSETANPLNFDEDVTKLTGSNWMSGISGDRYLNEINIPGAHDAGMARVKTFGNLASVSEKYAKTQSLNIYEQMESGVRMLDIRLSNKLNYDFLKDSPVVCHGDFQKIAGVENDMRYYALWNDYLTLDIVLDCCKRFLADNPTETVFLDLTYETGDRYETYQLARKNLGEYEDLIYKQNGSKIIKTMPQLKDVRGKVVILSKDTDMLGYGIKYNTGNDWGTGRIAGKTLQYENHYEADDEWKWNYVQAFFNGGSLEEWKDYGASSISAKKVNLPKNANEHLDVCNVVYTSANRAGTLGESPKTIAEYVNPRVYTNNDALFAQRGFLYGWIYSDFVTSETAKNLWITNYPDNLEYCTVKYVYGDGSTETFHVMKGTELMLRIDSSNPGDSFFDSWLVDGKSYSIGNRIVINKDTTITAQWLKGGSDQERPPEKTDEEKAAAEKTAKEKAAKELADAKTTATKALNEAKVYPNDTAVQTAVSTLNTAMSKNDIAAIKTATANLNKAIANAKAKKTAPVAKKVPAVKIKTAKKTLKASKLKKKARTFKIKFTKTAGSGKATFKKTGGSRKLTVSKAGKVKIRKGTRKGTYKIKVKISVAANKRFKAKSAKKTIKVKIK